jgi:Low affinity iron permease
MGAFRGLERYVAAIAVGGGLSRHVPECSACSTRRIATRAIQLKLDEILRANTYTRTQLVKLERLSDEELTQIEQEIVELGEEERD